MKYKPTKKQIEKKLKDQIVLLNDIVKVKLAPSPIHGVGVFAMRDIKKGEKLYTDIIPHQFDLPYTKFDKLEPEISRMILGQFPLVVKGSHFMYPMTRMAAFLNHSDTPNYNAKGDEALTDIKTGEEITEDYRQIEGFEIAFPFLVQE